MKNLFLLLFTSSILFLSCKKDNGSQKGSSEVDIYIVGRENTSVQCWKNGEKLFDNSCIIYNTIGTAVAVKNNDVYISGGIDNVAAYWKNGVITELGNRLTNSSANGIYFSGNDMYVTGMEISVPSNARAGYWKNGVFTKLTEVFGDARGLAVSGSDVYIAGNDLDTAVYWKNGQKFTLEKGIATDVKVVDGDVYISGYLPINQGNATIVYWKNGVKNIVETATSQYTSLEAYAIAVVKK
ncbi:MAG: hypothetical protein JNK79_00750 [Chitinophagaceae bacterium]|nr:hypothetical protein [Chitinophagaceae bacterium]